MNQRAKARPATVRPQGSSNFFADAAPAIGGILSVLIAYTFQGSCSPISIFTPSLSCCSCGCSAP